MGGQICHQYGRICFLQLLAFTDRNANSALIVCRCATHGLLPKHTHPSCPGMHTDLGVLTRRDLAAPVHAHQRDLSVVMASQERESEGPIHAPLLHQLSLARLYVRSSCTVIAVGWEATPGTWQRPHHWQSRAGLPAPGRNGALPGPSPLPVKSYSGFRISWELRRTRTPPYHPGRSATAVRADSTA